MNGKTNQTSNKPRTARRGGNRLINRNLAAVKAHERKQKLRTILELAKSNVRNKRATGQRVSGNGGNSPLANGGRRRGSSKPPSHAHRSAIITNSLHAEGSKLPVAKTSEHMSPKTYHEAVQKRFKPLSHNESRTSFTSENAPVSVGTTVEFHGSDEHKSLKDDGLHNSCSGRLYLQDVSNVAGPSVTPDPTWGPGARLVLCDLTPKSLGGRVLALSRQFQRFKFKKFRIIYVPSVSTATSGSFMLYYTNDMALTLSPVGTRELSHATATGTGVQFPVWEAASLDIHPKDLLKNFSSASTDASISAQGIFSLITASAIDFSSNPNGASGSYGSIYVDYEVEFWEPTLSFQIPARDMQFGSLTTGSLTNSIKGVSILAVCEADGSSAAIGGYMSASVPLPEGITSLEDAQDLMFIGILDGPRQSATPFAGRTLSWFDPILGEPATLGLEGNGMGFAARVEPILTGTFLGKWLLVVYPSIEGCSLSDGTAEDNYDPSAYQWASAAAYPADTVAYFKGYWTARD